MQWIRENPEDKSLSEELKQTFLNFDSLTADNQAQLLKSLLEMSGLPEQIKASLSYLTQDLDALPLPYDLILNIKERLSDLDIKNLGRVSKSMHALFQPPKQLLDKFLERVAFGMQDKVEALFTDVYAGNAAKIQEALRYRGGFTDYSGRTFKCTSYEYAYWAKDTHLCRMLERYMDDETKAFMLAQIDANDANGLTYQQNGTEHRSAHFDFTPLIKALKFVADSFEAWAAATNLDAFYAIKEAWMNVGLAQRDVPAHVAQEYCRPDRSFCPIPEFNEATLPRFLTFKYPITSQYDSWFPLKGPNSGLGFDFTIGRGPFSVPIFSSTLHKSDLAAITRLDEVRTADLMLSRGHLNPPAVSPAM